MSEAPSDSRVLRILGLCGLALYILLAVFFWTAWSFKTTWIDEAIILAVTAALAGLYFWGLKFARRAATPAIVTFAIGVSIIGFLMPPFDSTDVFFYMATGWQQAHYRGNPYSGSPRVIASLGRGNFWVTLRLFNFLNLAMHAGTALLLWKAGRLLPEGNGKVMLYLYTWNPLVVLQYLADLHNDVIVAFLVVLAAYLVLKDRPMWSLPLLVAAGLIKYVTLVLTPFAFIFLVRHKGWREGVRALLLSAALTVVTAAPYISEAPLFKYRSIWAQITESSGSLHAFGVYSFRSFGKVWPSLANFLPSFAVVTQIALWVVFAGFVIRELRVTWRDKSEEPLVMIQRWSSILFALIFVASSQFYAWYIGMVFPLALLTHRKTIVTDAVILLSGAHLLSFTFLRRKAIGYFLIATALPVLYLVIAKRPRHTLWLFRLLDQY